MKNKQSSKPPGPRDSLFNPEEEKVVEVEVERLKTFKDHPFKVQEDEAMLLLKDSIRRYGILNPLIVMPMQDGSYQIVSGHRRRYCAEALGYRKVPVIIRYMQEEDAVISMVDSNLQRSSISFSEKAFAYKMKNEAMKRKAGKKRKTQEGRLDLLKGRRTVEVIAEQVGDSPRQVTRYIRLTKLIPELLERLDKGELSFNPAVDLAFLTEEEQRWVLEAMDYTQATPSLSQTHRIRELSRKKEITCEKITSILSEVKKGDTNRVSFKNEQIYKYYPAEYTAEQIKADILDLLERVYG